MHMMESVPEEVFQPWWVLSDPHNISFLGNTGGVALAKSTNYGVWPLYLIVNVNVECFGEAYRSYRSGPGTEALAFRNTVHHAASRRIRTYVKVRGKPSKSLASNAKVNTKSMKE